MNASASLSIKIPARVQPSDMLIVTAAAAKHQHPRKSLNAAWCMRLKYDIWPRTRLDDDGHTMRRAQAMRTPFRRLGQRRARWLAWRATDEAPIIGPGWKRKARRMLAWMSENSFVWMYFRETVKPM